MKIVKRIMGLVTTGLIAMGCGSAARQVSDSDRPKTGTSIYSIPLRSLSSQDDIDLSQFKGQYVLFVNVASKCGYTYQYEGLEALYKAHSDKLMIIGMPCNQFGFQEPGDSTEIASFCQANYGVTFPISEKLDVKGANQHPVYEWLTKKEFNKKGNYDVSWNFNKFLISPEGKLIGYFGSKVEPQSPEIVGLLK